MPGCDKKHRAKGYCATHYNQLVVPVGERHKVRDTACVVCAAPLVRLPRGKIQPTCSPECRTIVQHGKAGPGGYDRDWAAAYRARRAGAQIVERISLTAVYERDNWTCYLCSQPVDREANCYQLNSATIDHVVPLAQGGSHTMQNTRCACLACNSTKGEYIDKQAVAMRYTA